MRILHINPTADRAYGGPVHWTFESSAILKERGVRSVLLTADAPDSEAIRTAPMEAVGVGPGSMGAFAHCPALPRWIREHASEFDAVVFHAIFTHGTWSGWKAARDCGLPFFAFPHGMLDPWFNKRYPLKRLKKQATWSWGTYPALRESDRVLFTNEPERELAEKSFRPYRVRPAVIRYGARRPNFDPEAARAEMLAALPELQGRRYFLFLSRIHPKKGVDILIQGYADAIGQDDGWRLVVAGPAEPGYGEAMRKIAEGLGLKERVLFPGMVKGGLKWGLMQDSEALALTSHQENFGIALAESMAVGRPVLITPGVNIWREVEASGSGFSAPDTREGAGELLRRCLSLSDEERAEMSRRAERAFEERFNVVRSAEDFLAVIQAVLEERSRAA
jgi:glycosyltransferase involved in cell wall biosynthesis